MTQVSRLISSDVGRPITDIVSDLIYPELTEDIRDVQRTLIPVEKQVISRKGSWFNARILPWHTLDDNELIGIFSNFAHDTEFKVILQHGLYIYNKQINHLEQLALKLNVPLPNRPSLPVSTAIDPESITDKFMYRIVLSWELSSLDNHVRAIIETIRNDSLRKLWSGLLTTELEYYDKFLKYGKMKGWTRVVPTYGEPVS